MTQQLYIKTDGPIPEGCGYITAGKVYPVLNLHGSLADIYVNRGHISTIKVRYEDGSGCAHIGPAAWQFCDQHGNPVPAPWEESTPAKSVQCQCFNEPDWPSPEIAKGQPICDEFLARARDPHICERCEHNEGCHIPQINYRAHAEALAEALERIASWPDGGNQYGQSHIKMFAAKALAAFDQDRGELQ